MRNQPILSEGGLLGSAIRKIKLVHTSGRYAKPNLTNDETRSLNKLTSAAAEYVANNKLMQSKSIRNFSAFGNTFDLEVINKGNSFVVWVIDQNSRHRLGGSYRGDALFTQPISNRFN